MIHPIAMLLACGCVTISGASLAEPQCHSNDAYHIAALPYDEDAGNRFAVTRLHGKPSPADCSFDENSADFVIGKPGDALWFGELAGDTLILSRSTGPQGDLVVYDLASRKPILDVPSDEYELNGTTISFWQRMGQATRETCPSFAENEANGLGSVTAVRKTLDLSSGAVTETADSKCVAVQ